MQIAIDGPASSGKSTVAKRIAQELGIIYIDTGAMYRAVTYACLTNQGVEENIDDILLNMQNLSIRFKNIDGNKHVFINNEDITKIIRSDKVTQHVSYISSLAPVREHLVSLQREMARNSDVIMDGRDIGTVVLPQADFKFFLVASSRVRAQRRYDENIQKGLSNESLEIIEAKIIERDRWDSQREHSPLKKAEDAIEIDTSHLSIDQVVEKILSYIS